MRAMKKERVSLSLELDDYDRKENIPVNKRAKKTVSLSLSDDDFKEHKNPTDSSSVPHPSQPQTHQKLVLFGVCISIDENVNPNSLQTDKNPNSSSNPNLLLEKEKPFRVIIDQSVGPSGVTKKRRSKPSTGKSRSLGQDYSKQHHRHLELLHHQSSSNPNLRVIIDQSVGPSGVRKTRNSKPSNGKSRLYEQDDDNSEHHHHHHQELLHPQSSSNPNLEKPFRVIIGQSAGPSGVKKRRNPKPSNGKSRLYKQDDNSEHHHHRQEPPLLSPAILEHIQSNGGTQPVFLFQKWLTKSDTQPYLNRIFISRNPQKLLDFLTEVERHEVTDGQGVEVVTIDPKGDYYNLQLTVWGSLDMFVLKREWYKLVKANQFEEGDLVQLWAYRQNAEFHLALQISRKDRRRGGSAGDGSGRSTVSTA